MDRVALLKALDPAVAMSGTQAETVRKLLDKALVQYTIALPLDAAQSLPQHFRQELTIVLSDVCTAGELAKIASKWEPKRKLDAALKETLKRDLIDLLNARRAQYDALPTITLVDARKSGDEIATTIERLAPTKDLKSLLKSWDKHLKPAPATRPALVRRLLDLLRGTPPTERAATASSRRAA